MLPNHIQKQFPRHIAQRGGTNHMQLDHRKQIWRSTEADRIDKSVKTDVSGQCREEKQFLRQSKSDSKWQQRTVVSIRHATRCNWKSNRAKQRSTELTEQLFGQQVRHETSAIPAVWPIEFIQWHPIIVAANSTTGIKYPTSPTEQFPIQWPGGQARPIRVKRCVPGQAYDYIARDTVHFERKGAPNAWSQRSGEGNHKFGSYEERSIVRFIP